MRVDGVWLLHKDVFTRSNRRRHMHGVEFGGIGDDDYVRQLDDVLVSIEPGEAVILRKNGLFGSFCLEETPFFLGPVEQQIAGCYQVDSRIGLHSFESCVGTAASAA